MFDKQLNHLFTVFPTRNFMNMPTQTWGVM